jgi:hypothetical protein
MALESKPLFHPEVIRQQVRAFNLREPVGDWQPKLQHWAGLIASGRADDFKETALLPDFLADIFCGLLGYAGPAASADTFTFSRERHVEVDGKVADAVLGRFQKGEEQFVAVLEGKGARDPLDHPFAGRRMSAVDQAYRYAINLPCARKCSLASATRTPPSPSRKSSTAFRSCGTAPCTAPVRRPGPASRRFRKPTFRGSPPPHSPRGRAKPQVLTGSLYSG